MAPRYNVDPLLFLAMEESAGIVLVSIFHMLFIFASQRLQCSRHFRSAFFSLVLTYASNVAAIAMTIWQSNSTWSGLRRASPGSSTYLTTFYVIDINLYIPLLAVVVFLTLSFWKGPANGPAIPFISRHPLAIQGCAHALLLVGWGVAIPNMQAKLPGGTMANYPQAEDYRKSIIEPLSHNGNSFVLFRLIASLFSVAGIWMWVVGVVASWAVWEKMRGGMTAVQYALGRTDGARTTLAPRYELHGSFEMERGLSRRS